DRDHFDALARLVSAQHSRRSALSALLGAVVLGRESVATASSKRKRKGKKRGEQRRMHRRGDRDAGNRRGANNRKQNERSQARAEAVPGRCCSRNACLPGPGKNLGKCCFEDANLVGQSFRGANLGQTNFSRAILTDADFRSANLDRTCLVDADVTGATFTGANLGTAIFCRTQTDSGEDNSGCGRGTICCPTCDADHLCDEGELCCDGRCVAGNCCDNGERSTCGAEELCCDHLCVAGECCRAAGCRNEICQRRACQEHQCVYTPVFGEPGPECPTLCCRNAQGVPDCCDAGVAVCTVTGLCRCREDQDCAADEVCCDGACEIPIWANETTFGTGSGDGPSQFENMIGVAVSGDEQTAWIVDQRNSRVSVWSRQASGQWENEALFGSLGSGLGQFNLPFGVAVADNGLTAFVGDQGSPLTLTNSRVSVWRKQPNGSWTNPFSLGNGTGDDADQFENPTGVAVSGDGRTLWVADTGNKRISVWTESNGLWAPLTRFGSAGSGPGQFSDPVGVAVSGDGQTVWVIDRINTRVSVWARQSNGNWTFDTDFGSFGDGATQWRGPLGVAVAADGQTAFVSDLGHDRISMWTRQANGGWVHDRNFGSGRGDGRNQFAGPFGLAVSADGQTFWVTDAGNHRVSIWSRSGCPAA
ncbi:MAG: pentapeptide repeat-containing protein, partial [Thermomicrobiales bacterium]